MTASGLALSRDPPASGRCMSATALFMGLLGNGALDAPLLIYVSRWFDRRRGTALALISSGQYIAGVVWPFVIEHGIERLRLAGGNARLCRRDISADPAV